jgi:hypothetical protein
MIVRFLRRTYTDKLGFVSAGMVIEVDEQTAERWLRKRIAVIVEDKPQAVETLETVETAESIPVEPLGENEQIDFENLTYKELLDYCKNNGIEIEGRPKKAEIIAKLKGD